MCRKDTRISVLCGGVSREREISLASGRAVSEALLRAGCLATLVEIDRAAIANQLRGIDADIVFNTLHGGFGENGTLQAILEKKGLPFTGSGSRASAKAFNKMVSKEIFASGGLRVPKGALWRQKFSADDLPFEYPVVIKPREEGSSIGVYIIRRPAEFAPAVEKASQISGELMIEEFIEGRELTVGILDEEALEPIEIKTEESFYDYRAKYESKGTRYIVPAVLPEDAAREAKASALTAHRALGCRHISRIDMILGNDERIYILEANTSPGMTSRSLLPKAAELAGLSFDKLCLKVLSCAMKGPALDGGGCPENKNR